jgi:hypothetical protein
VEMMIGDVIEMIEYDTDEVSDNFRMICDDV